MIHVILKGYSLLYIVIALLVGVLAGPLVVNGLNPYTWKDYHEITKQLTRCIIAIQVMAVGIELPQ
jgi:NhaP-type Na+/H+ or K+/H+ antiporter